jgi:hypothetical protein
MGIRLLCTFLVSCFLLAQQVPPALMRDDATRRAKEERRFDLSRLPKKDAAALVARVQAEFLKRNKNPKRILPLLAGATSATTWRSLGPTTNSPLGDMNGGIWKTAINDSGRIQSIVTHPTDPHILYLSTAGGGVWKTTAADPRSTTPWPWVPITDGLPPVLGRGTVSTGFLAMAPDDPNRLYLTMGDWNGGGAAGIQGNPMYFTRDAGGSWEPCSLPTSPTSLLSFKGLLALPGGVVLVTGRGAAGGDLLLRSTDGAQTFRILPLPIGYQSGGPTGFLHLQGKILLLADGFSIFRSEDAGLNWTRCATDEAMKDYPALPPLGRMTLATSPANPSIVYGIYRWQDTANSDNFAPGVLKSTDGGVNWMFLKAPQGQQWNIPSNGGQAYYNHLLSVDPTNPDVVFCAANFGIYRSTDGGQSWIQLTGWPQPYCHPDNHAAAWAIGSTKALYIGHDGGLSALVDPLRVTPPNVQLDPNVDLDPTYLNHSPSLGIASHLAYGFACTDADTPVDAKARILVYMQDNGVSQRLGSGSSLWESSQYGTVLGGDGFAALLHPLDGNKALVAAQGNFIRRTADGFQTLTDGTQGLPTYPEGGYNPFETALEQGGEPDGNTVYCFKRPCVYRSQDFGGNWAPIPPPPLHADVNEAIEFLSASPFGAGTVAVSTFPEGRSYLTSDAGSTWKDITPNWLQSTYGGRFHFDPRDPQTLYESFDSPSIDTSSYCLRSLIKSADGGQTWFAVDGDPQVGGPKDNGFPCGLPCYDVNIDPTNPQRILAATEIGVYLSMDGGGTWAPYGQGMPMVRVTKLYISKDGQLVRAATFGRGIWEIGNQPPLVPYFRTQPQSVMVNPGGGATFTVDVGGTAPWTYQWQKDGLNLAGATSATWSIPSVSSADAGTYRVVVTNAVGSVTSDGAVLSVEAAPAITTQPQSLTVLQGQPASFSVVASGVPVPTYQWQKDGLNLAGATSATWSIPSVSSADAGTYRVVVTNAVGSVTSDGAVLSVEAAPAITTQPQSLTVLQGQPATFSVVASGVPSPTYQWQKDGLNLAGATSATWSISSVSSADAGTYRVVVSNAVGSLTSNDAALTVSVPAILEISPRPTLLWEGGAVTFTSLVNGASDPETVWTITNGSSTTSLNGATALVNPLPGTLVVKASTSSTPAATDQVTTEVRGRDQDRDGKVTVLDMAALADAYGRTATDPQWALFRLADLNADGKVDNADLDLFLQGLK